VLLLAGVAAAAEEQAPAAAPAPAISIMLDGAELVTEPAPYIVNDRTLVPMRAIFEALDATVTWDETERSVTAVRDTDTILLYIGSTTAYVNEAAVILEAAPEIDAATWRTMVPLRFVSEALGCDVDWKAETLTVIIDTDKEENEPPKPGKYVTGGAASILDTIRERNFDDGDVLRYTVKGGEVDKYIVLYDYSEDSTHPNYPAIRATLDKLSGSVLVIDPAPNTTPTTLRLDEDTIFFDASSDKSGAHEPLTKAEFGTFRSDPIIIWTETALENRGSDDLVRLVIRIRR
ncbi:MAG: copper amine oxidase N-terminal domain-containing protein, partial [Syntrophomonadaceae bacterium]|nr:copper amine oxidase N-terminal domain-containing protein [Syntrophomonadaceae bacterium]